MSRRPRWQPAFLTTLRNVGNVRLACQAAGVSRQVAYRRRDADPAFAQEWQAAIEEAADLLESA